MDYSEMILQLQSRFPNLVTSQTMIECDVGWHKLICNYCFMIERLVEKGVCNHTPILLIKEKWGRLNLHHSIDAEGVDFEICQTLQYMIEHMSVTTCEKCGKNGKVVNVRGWYKCLCEECEKKVNQ